MSIDVVADSSLNSVKGRSHWSDCDTCLGLLFFLSALHSFVSSFLRFFVPSFFLQFFFFISTDSLCLLGLLPWLLQEALIYDILWNQRDEEVSLA